jgi:hypothetical protein
MRVSIALRRGTGLPASLTLATASAGARAIPEIGAKIVSAEVHPKVKASFPRGATGPPDVTYTSRFGYRLLELDRHLPPDSVTARGP